MSMNKKILLVIVPVFAIAIGAYSALEIMRTQKSYQKDFDESVKTSMTILGPALINNIYNLENFSAENSIKGIFANSNIEQAISFTEAKGFFAGVSREKDGKLTSLKEPIKLEEYAKNFNVTTEKKFYVYSYSGNLVRFVYPLWSKATEGKPETFGGIFVIEASVKALNERISSMIIRLILGLSISILIAVIITYFFLQIQIVKPIVRLMQASLDIAGGKFTKLPAPKDIKSDELAMLTSNFNFMVNKIERNLILIRGISEASQEIVKCKTFNEIVEIVFKHCSSLVQAGQVDIWISSKGQPTEDATSLKRITDSQILDSKAPLLEELLKARDVLPLETNLSGSPQKGLCIPLINGRGVLLGLIEVYFGADKSQFGEEEIRIANGLGISATTAIENCWRVEAEKDKANMERDLELASAVQDSIVSKVIPKNSNCEVATFYKTAGSCGGDWFGAYEVGENKLLVLFGDVTGHGTPAALITAVTRGSADMMRHFIMKQEKAVDSSLPAQALEFLNQCVHGTGRQTYFMTMVAALIDFSAQTIHASSAGHTPPVLITLNEEGKVGSVKYFYPKVGNRLGFQKDSQYESQSFTFVPGQQVVFYTDGIIEGENPAAREYGMKKFKQSMEAHGTCYPDELVSKVSHDAFTYFNGTPPKDDIAMLAVRFLTEEEKKERSLIVLTTPTLEVA